MFVSSSFFYFPHFFCWLLLLCSWNVLSLSNSYGFLICSYNRLLFRLNANRLHNVSISIYIYLFLFLLCVYSDRIQMHISRRWYDHLCIYLLWKFLSVSVCVWFWFCVYFLLTKWTNTFVFQSWQKYFHGTLVAITYCGGGVDDMLYSLLTTASPPSLCIFSIIFFLLSNKNLSLLVYGQ